MALMTQAKLAAHLGLSRSTVAAALNPQSRITLRDATRKQVLRAAQRLNYRPHRYAQIMRTGKSGLIGIFHFGGLSQVAAERAWHASRAIQAAGYQILANDASWTTGGVTAACEAMIDARAEGVIVAGLNDSLSVKELTILQTVKIPLVTLSGEALPNTPHVRADAQAAFADITRHLISQGRRRLLLLISLSRHSQHGNYTWAGAERLSGFRDTLAEFKGREVTQYSRSHRAIQGRIVSLEFISNRFDPFRQAHEALRDVLVHSPHPDAVICSNDDWAIGALHALREARLTVPDTIAVTGFDNTAIGSHLDVPLTTIAQPSQAMAEHAVKLLLKKIHGKRVPVAPIKFPCKLILRASCGMPARSRHQHENPG